MKFDDFNYQLFNPYILVADDKTAAGAKKNKPDGLSSSVTHMDDGGPALSVHALEAKNFGTYDFKSISVHTPDNRDEHPADDEAHQEDASEQQEQEH